MPLMSGVAVVLTAAAGVTWFAASGSTGSADSPWAAADRTDPGAVRSPSALPSAPAGVAATPLVRTQSDVTATTGSGPNRTSNARTGSAGNGSTGGGSTEEAVPPFTTLVYEAEAGMPDVRLVAAKIVAQTGASGGSVVEFTDPAQSEIQFRLISVHSAGTYRFTVYYVPGDVARSGLLAVGSAAPVTIAFAAGSGCCSIATVDLALVPGMYTASLTLSAGAGSAPAIDQVVISQP